MKRYTYLLIACCALVFLFACGQQQPTAEDVIAKMTEASGGADELSSVNDRVETWRFTMYQMPPEMQMQEKEGGMEAMEEDTMEGKMTAMKDTMERKMTAMEDTMEGEMTAMEDTMEGEMGEEGMTMEMVITAKKPNMIRMDFPTPMGTMSTAYNGSTGWSTTGGQFKELQGAELQDWQDMAATWLDGYMNSTEKGYSHELIATEVVDGEECYVLKTTDMNGNVKTNYISTTSSLLIKFTGEMTNMAGEKERMTMTMEDYKPVDGLTLAHNVTLHDANGDKVWHASLEEVEINTGVEDTVFQPKEGTTAK